MNDYFDMSNASIHIELMRLADRAHALRVELDRRHSRQQFYDLSETLGEVDGCTFVSGAIGVDGVPVVIDTESNVVHVRFGEE